MVGTIDFSRARGDALSDFFVVFGLAAPPTLRGSFLPPSDVNQRWSEDEVADGVAAKLSFRLVRCRSQKPKETELLSQSIFRNCPLATARNREYFGDRFGDQTGRRAWDG